MTDIETCPICGEPMCFERMTEDMPHEYDVCNRCGKHICGNCSKDIDETPYCPDCWKELVVLHPNCSEATLRFNVTGLSDEVVKKVLEALEEIEKEHNGEQTPIKTDAQGVVLNGDEKDEQWWYDTWFCDEMIYNTRTIKVQGDVPYNNYDNLMAALNQKLSGTVITKEESAEFNTRVDMLTKNVKGRKHVKTSLAQILETAECD